jgi:lipopolysaccharide/colanic/teichoic acid biosynthesis glycosyltransferase
MRPCEPGFRGPMASARADVPARCGRSVPARSPWRRISQRVFDVLGATVFLVILSPLLAIIALWIRLDSPGRVVFGHQRVGLLGRPFRCLKFRTMHEGAERMVQVDESLHRLYVENDYKLPAGLDPRVTRSGRWLRRSSLDELPQLVNVLRGEMSLVGPRPVVACQLELLPGLPAPPAVGTNVNRAKGRQGHTGQGRRSAPARREYRKRRPGIRAPLSPRQGGIAAR